MMYLTFRGAAVVTEVIAEANPGTRVHFTLTVLDMCKFTAGVVHF
jgi:hypothetical protein